MINYKDLFEIYDHFGYVFYYGLSHKYSFDYMQKRIANCKEIKDLENKNDCSFLINSKVADIISEIYELKDNKANIDEICPDTLSLWISEAYLRLSFKFHKSLSFVFLYFPIDKMINAFSPYHEIDWTQLYDYFKEEISSKPLLRKILDYKHLSVNKLSQLTGISKNTLTTYLDNQRLSEAKFDYIYRISQALDIDINVFANRINNFEQEDFNKTFANKELFSTLAKWIVSYYSSEIANRNYIYNKDKELYVDGNNYLKVFITNDKANFTIYNSEAEKLISKYKTSEKAHTVIVIYELDNISKTIDPYKKWLEYGFEKIFIVNSNTVICLKESYWQSYLGKDIQEKMLTRLI